MSTRNRRSVFAGLTVARATSGRWIWRIAKLSIASVASSALLFWLFYNEVLDAMFGGDLPLYFAPEEMEALANQIPGVQETMLIWAGALIAVNTILTIAVALYINLKVSGPMLRIKRDLEQIANGDLTVEVKLRDRDDFKDVADIINSMVTRLHIMMIAVRESASTVAEVSATVESKRDRETLEHCSSQLVEQLEYFETIDLSGGSATASENDRDSADEPVATPAVN